MKHILKLQPKYFDYINDGTKKDRIKVIWWKKTEN